MILKRPTTRLYTSAWRIPVLLRHDDAYYAVCRNLGYVMVALLGGYMVIRGNVAVGDIQAFFQYIRNFTQPIQQIAQVTNMLQSSAAAAERVFEFLDEEEEDQTVENPVDIPQLRWKCGSPPCGLWL